MSRALPAVVAALALFVVPTATSAPTSPQAAPTTESWIELELELIASNRLDPPRAARALAHVSSAMHLASLAPRPEPAVAGAAATVLAHLFPDERERLEAAARAGAGTTRADAVSFAFGVLVGKALVFRAEHDRSDAVWTGSPPVGPGFWVPTPPGFLPPLEPLAGTWRTWNLRSGSQFRPPPPPAYGTPQFVAERDEVLAVAQGLTVEQKRIADFWADGAGTVTPPGHWNVIALELVRERNLSTRAAARLFAVLNTAQADAFIACWDAKFEYWFLRPVTAIRELPDQSSFLSYIATPPFPSYVSGHSSTSGAAATVLAAFFPAKAAQLAAVAEEAAVSRLYGGIHFRSDNEAGLVLGRRVGERALRAYGLR